VIKNRPTRDAAPDHEFEAAPGLPEPLPRGEHLLWQGSPDWRVMARMAMHTRLLSVYFALLLGVRGINVLANGGSASDAGMAMLWLLPLAVAALGLLALLAWLVCRTSLYTLTDRRVVMRLGVVLGITFNLPYSQIESVGLRHNADGTGDITLLLADTDRIAYMHLWPHARPWHLKRAEPMLRALPQVQGVAEILSKALLAASISTARIGRAPIQVSLKSSAERVEPQALAV
jgi:Bacterial PH domain